MMLGDFIAHAFQLTNNKPIQPIGLSTICAICAKPIDAGYPSQNIISNTTSDIPDTFRTDWVCSGCAACFAQSKFLTSNLLALPNQGIKPLISLSDPTRPAWRNLVRTIPIGTPTVAIITSNTKRRLWRMAKISIFGDTWQPLFVDGTIEQTLIINIHNLLPCLSLVESIYSQGFSKPAIAEGLISSQLPTYLKKHTLPEILAYEKALAAYRGSNEFTLALFIAQKDEK